MKKYKLIRYIQFSDLFELFFVTAILTILAIRLYLYATGYPQLGAGGIHIAHMLWGGLFMMLSIFMLLAFLNDSIKPYAAILGGIGFGTFIDELGKFITRDNNYFFQPTFAIIYIIFIYLYLLFKTVEGRQQFTKDEYLVNSLDKLKEIIINDLDKQEQEEALLYLSRSDQKNPITHFLKKAFLEIHDIPQGKVGPYTRIRDMLSDFYYFLVKKTWFLKLVVVLFMIRATFYLLEGVLVASVLVEAILTHHVEKLFSASNIFNSIEFFAITVQAAFIIAGALIIRKNRVRAYIYFKNAVLLSILVIQIFNFYQDPALAFVFTLGDLILFAILSYMISKEDTR